MSDEKIVPETGDQKDSASEPSAAVPSPAADQKISLSLDEFKTFMKSTVEDILKNSKSEEARKQAEEYNSKIAESVKNSQASIIRSDIPNGQKPVDYIKGVLSEDNRRRLQSGEGKALYSDKGEDFKKAKIVLLHKMGLTEEEIAENLKDIL